MNKGFFILVVSASVFLFSCSKKKSAKIELNVFTVDNISSTDGTKLSDGIASLCLPYYEADSGCTDVALVPTLKCQRIDLENKPVFEFSSCENTLVAYKEKINWFTAPEKLEEIAKENLNLLTSIPEEFKAAGKLQPSEIDSTVNALINSKEGTKFYCYSDNASISQYLNLPVYHLLDSLKTAILRDNCTETGASVFILYNVAHEEALPVDSSQLTTATTGNETPQVNEVKEAKVEEVVAPVKTEAPVHKKVKHAPAVTSTPPVAEPAKTVEPVVNSVEATAKTTEVVAKSTGSGNIPANATLNITHTDDDLAIQWNDLGKGVTYDITVFYPEDNTSFHAKPTGLTYSLSNLEHKNHNYSVLLVAKDRKGHKVRACFNNFHITEDGKIVSGFCDQLRDRLQNKCD